MPRLNAVRMLPIGSPAEGNSWKYYDRRGWFVAGSVPRAPDGPGIPSVARLAGICRRRTFAVVRQELEATGSVYQFDRTLGADGKYRPASRDSAKPHGEHKRKLTEDDVRAILRANESNKVLAARYGVTAPNINAIRKGLSWRHVTL